MNFRRMLFVGKLLSLAICQTLVQILDVKKLFSLELCAADGAWVTRGLNKCLKVNTFLKVLANRFSWIKKKE